MDTVHDTSLLYINNDKDTYQDGKAAYTDDHIWGVTSVHIFVHMSGVSTKGLKEDFPVVRKNTNIYVEHFFDQMKIWWELKSTKKNKILSLLVVRNSMIFTCIWDNSKEAVC